MAITINGSGITSANIADGTITASDISASEVKNLKSGRKNLLINGGFDVWQRGTSFTSGYTADRWYSWTGANTVTKVTGGLRLEGPNDGATLVEQRIENSGEILAGKTITISVTCIGTPLNARLYPYSRTANNGSWQHTGPTKVLTEGLNTATWNVPSDAGHINIRIASDGGGLVDVTVSSVQLELGSVATDFEHRSYGEELALCQRYWQQSYEIGTKAGTVTSAGCYQNRTGSSTSSMYRHITLPVGMRTSPTIKLYGTSSTTNDVGKWRGSGDTTIYMSSSYPSHNSFNVNGTMNQNYTYLSGHWTADAEL